MRPRASSGRWSIATRADDPGIAPPRPFPGSAIGAAPGRAWSPGWRTGPSARRRATGRSLRWTPWQLVKANPHLRAGAAPGRGPLRRVCWRSGAACAHDGPVRRPSGHAASRPRRPCAPAGPATAVDRACPWRHRRHLVRPLLRRISLETTDVSRPILNAISPTDRLACSPSSHQPLLRGDDTTGLGVSEAAWVSKDKECCNRSPSERALPSR